jgi:hypothetical protein
MAGRDGMFGADLIVGVFDRPNPPLGAYCSAWKTRGRGGDASLEVLIAECKRYSVLGAYDYPDSDRLAYLKHFWLGGVPPKEVRRLIKASRRDPE